MTETPKHREQLGDWMVEQGLTGRMIEVGVAFGGFARHVLSQWQGTEYVLVDPWIRQEKDVYKENTEGIDYEGWYRDCQALAGSDTRVRLMRGCSTDIARQVQDDCADSVYIDGNHCYDAVKADLAAWWPKVKRGGLFGGHDYYNAVHSGHYCQVEQAVIEWAKEQGQTVQLTECSSWWVRKA